MRHPYLKIRGIGGSLMVSAGLEESFFPMNELSLMGLAEIIPHIPKMLRRIDQTVEAIRVFNPDIILTIDAPEFSHRVQKKLQAEKISGKRVHMVAPSVWAWRADRAQKIARFLDGLLCLLPFEPPFFERYGLKSEFMGHPVMDMEGVQTANGPAFRFRHMIGLDQKMVGLFFGSRRSEIEKMGSIFLQVAKNLQQHDPNIGFICPTTYSLRASVESLLRTHHISAHIVTDPKEKWDAFAACNVAAATSGTVGLELSILNIPHVISYKMNSLTWAVVNRVVTTKFAHLSNNILNKEVVPEFLQEKADPQMITESLLTFLNDRDKVQMQRNDFAEIRAALTTPHKKSAAQAAADFIESL